MKNLHIIQTEKPPIKGDLLLRHLWKGKPNECISWWRYNDTNTYGDTVVYTTLNGSFMDSPSSFKTQHIYITNSEEIKFDDYITDGYKVWQWKDDSSLLGRKKIILTTDQNLINDGVQKIDDEFLEWFVKNPSCENLEVEIDYSKSVMNYSYKIVIPKEEPKQETLEEVAANLADPNICKTDNWIAGAKYQAERMYSEEEVLTIVKAFDKEFYQGIVERNGHTNKWFEQFKKK